MAEVLSILGVWYWVELGTFAAVTVSVLTMSIRKEQSARFYVLGDFSLLSLVILVLLVSQRSTSLSDGTASLIRIAAVICFLAVVSMIPLGKRRAALGQTPNFLGKARRYFILLVATGSALLNLLLLSTASGPLLPPMIFLLFLGMPVLGMVAARVLRAQDSKKVQGHVPKTGSQSP